MAFIGGEGGTGTHVASLQAGCDAVCVLYIRLLLTLRQRRRASTSWGRRACMDSTRRSTSYF